MPPKVAVLTMLYNEAALLPVWCRHYARQVGADHCYVIDHGSNDLPSVPPGVNVMRLPRSPEDPERQAQFLSDLCAGFLAYYDWVAYAAVDEIILADPARHPHLPAFCAQAPAPVMTTIGLDIQHRLLVEPPLDCAQPVGPQRGWARFSPQACKPLLVRRPIAWRAGFTGGPGPAAFSGLYLFRLRWADFDIGLQRATSARTSAWAANPAAPSHPRPSEWTTDFEARSALPVGTADDFKPDQEPLRPLLNAVRAGHHAEPDGPPVLWPIPERFRAAL